METAIIDNCQCRIWPGSGTCRQPAASGREHGADLGISVGWPSREGDSSAVSKHPCTFSTMPRSRIYGPECCPAVRDAEVCQTCRCACNENRAGARAMRIVQVRVQFHRFTRGGLGERSRRTGRPGCQRRPHVVSRQQGPAAPGAAWALGTAERGMPDLRGRMPYGEHHERAAGRQHRSL